jgi:methionine aminotransferase
VTASIVSRLPQVGTTIFTVMSALAAEHQAINLGQGFPDFPMNETLIDLVYQAMRAGHNQYVHMNGLPLLRERIAEKVAGSYGITVHPETEITVTPGGTYAIFTALTAILQPGDEVIVFEPAYDSYIPNIELNGGIVVPIALQAPGFRIPWAEVRKKMSPKTRAIVINSPHNPTGQVLEESDIAELTSILTGTNTCIISDEVYEHLIFDGKPHLSLLRYPELRERTFACYSFGKVYHCTGWKMGYCVAPPALMQEFRKVHQFNCFTCHAPVQHALASFLQEKAAYLELGSFLQQKRDYFAGLMQATRFKPIPSYGSYFQLYDYSAISDEPELAFAKRLTVETGVTSIPVSAFYRTPVNQQVLRFCFAKQETTLQQAAERLQKV